MGEIGKSIRLIYQGVKSHGTEKDMLRSQAP
jgi:hypothetical protein